jgi:hypothetical protein
MKDRKVSNIVALAVTLLAVVTAVSFSLSSLVYYREVVGLRKVNAQNCLTIERYKKALESIQQQLSEVSISIQ